MASAPVTLKLTVAEANEITEALTHAHKTWTFNTHASQANEAEVREAFGHLGLIEGLLRAFGSPVPKYNQDNGS